MVDVVTNHMGYIANGNTTVDYSIYDVFDKVGFDPTTLGITDVPQSSYYHSYTSCSGISTEPALETCWEGDTIVMLPDLRTEDTDVRTLWNTWIANLVATYTIDGLRIDSCTEVEPGFFPGFQSAGQFSCTGPPMGS